MKRATLAALGTGAVIGSAAAIGWGDSPAATPTLSIAEYQNALARIDARRGNALTLCDAVETAQREVCRTEASADAMVRVADVEERYRHDDRSAREAQRARIDAQYQVARARCQALSGYRKDKCLISAHATRGRALLAAHAPYEMR
jgi:triphosphoribosyl-dephospho-CoA synthetase